MITLKKLNFLSQNSADVSVQEMYVSAIDASRHAWFYENCQVSDTPEGRFDILSLHMVLLLRNLKHAPSYSQKLFDLFFADMDQNLREMGVGDLKVGRQIKKMATNFYGVLDAYDEALDQMPVSLKSVLVRNVYEGRAPDDNALKLLEQYVRESDQMLVRQRVPDHLPEWPSLKPETEPRA